MEEGDEGLDSFWEDGDVEGVEGLEVVAVVGFRGEGEGEEGGDGEVSEDGLEEFWGEGVE